MQTSAILQVRPYRARINVLLTYDRMSSALWAADTFAALFPKSAGAPTLSLYPWSFGVLGNPTWCGLAAAESLHSDMIVISTSSRFMEQLPPPIEYWLEMSLNQRERSSHLAVVALFRSDSLNDGCDSPRLQKIQNLVRQAGCDFFAPLVTGSSEGTNLNEWSRRAI